MFARLIEVGALGVAQDVTKAQAGERAAARSLHNQHTLDRYIVPDSSHAALPSRAPAGALTLTGALWIT